MEIGPKIYQLYLQLTQQKKNNYTFDDFNKKMLEFKTPKRSQTSEILFDPMCGKKALIKFFKIQNLAKVTKLEKYNQQLRRIFNYLG